MRDLSVKGLLWRSALVHTVLDGPTMVMTLNAAYDRGYFPHNLADVPGPIILGCLIGIFMKRVLKINKTLLLAILIRIAVFLYFY